MDKSSKKNLILNIVIILLLTSLVLTTLLRGEDKEELFLILKASKGLYVFLGIILSLFFVVGEAINIRELLKIFGYDYALIKTLKYAFTGFFFSSITPSSTGGQPMQVYEMKRDDIEVSHSSLVLLLILVVYQLVTVIYGLGAFVYLKSRSFEISGAISYLIILGLILNLLCIGLIVFAIFSPRLSNALYKLFGKILSFLPLKEEKKEKILENLKKHIDEYNLCSKYIKSNKRIIGKVFIVTFFQLGSMLSLSYIVYRALGQTGTGYLSILSIQSLIYIGSSYIPIPGAIGISESNFLWLFKGIYSPQILNGALILSRGISFYLLLIISIVSLSYYKFKEYKASPLVNKDL